MCHLATLIGWIIPFSDLIITAVIWSTRKDTSEFVRFHGLEALNYQITFYLATIIAVALTWVLIGIPLLALLMIIDITVPIFMAIKASNGEMRRYPLILRLVQ
ncbi:DUF4870 domain-containing protein [Candidatus Chloroploca sp. M-50]|uniref:DUF4870 domain-containing protein n=2 Tax=Candidatus Chloroploca mongolica TaxID=2528176 RepID=A0ABS4D4R2_9CHLR|nr:DUF4870 domain-containing protein [Candidatus Chloroploca mongolica]